MSARPQLDHDENGVKQLTEEETWELLDQRARTLLGMTGEEFLRRWKAGEFRGQDERSDLWDVAMLLGGLNP